VPESITEKASSLASAAEFHVKNEKTQVSLHMGRSPSAFYGLGGKRSYGREKGFTVSSNFAGREATIGPQGITREKWTKNLTKIEMTNAQIDVFGGDRRERGTRRLHILRSLKQTRNNVESRIHIG